MKKPTTPAGPFVTKLATIISQHVATSGKPIDLPEILARVKKDGYSVTWDDLRELRHYNRGSAVVNPEFVTDFLTSYAASRKPQSVLDPWAGIGSTLLPIAQTCKLSAATGISPSESDTAIARIMDEESRVTWIHAQPFDAVAELGTYDLVVCSPPIGLPAQTLTVTEGTARVSVRDSGTYALVFESARHLSKVGVGVFMLPNGFFFQQGKALARDALGKCGLYVNAVIALPVGVHAPYTAIPLNLVFVSWTPTTDLFVAHLAPGIDQKVLLNNLTKRQNGGSVELGRLVPVAGFTSWQQVAAREEEALLAKRTGLAPIAFRDVVSAINLGKQTDDGGFANLPNCVYLPLIGTSPAVSSLSDLQIKPQNYAQLVVRPDLAHADFLAGFFNSPLGRKTRDTMLSGTFIPKISKTTLTDGTAYVLPLDLQQTATSVARELRDLRLRLEQLERDLWNRPVQAASVRKAVGALTQKEGFESWLETLPFPLASILRRYHAAASAEKKVDHLFHACEALAQFLGTLMASAFHSNPDFFREHRADWFDQGKDNPHSLARSSFGQWVVRCQRLAKTTRQMLSDKEQRVLVLDCYRADAERIENLANKGIYTVLDTVSQYRNNWKGHSGIVSAKEHERRLTLLQEELTRLRAAIAGVFDDWWLVRPGANTYTGGVFHYSAERLMGSNQIFKQEAITTTEVMDANELYCYDNLTQRPLQLLHFVRMLPAPDTEETACYFYNRLEKNGVRWISYHFEKEAERLDTDAAVIKTINELEGT